MRDEQLPTTERMLAWIEQVFAQGVRRPGHPADRWAERFAAEQFEALGLERVRLEPVAVPYWEPNAWSLRVLAGDDAFELPCFPLPFSAPIDGVELELARFDAERPEAVRGRAALCPNPLLRIAPPGVLSFHPDTAGDPSARIVDPRGTFKDAEQVLPFGPRIQAVMEPALDAGAAAFIGALTGYPGDSCEYYVPYDGVERPIPGVWIRGSDHERVERLLARGPVRVQLRVEASRGQTTCHNVVGELPGADDEQVVIGTHHDGPWSSAVEDASGMALVLAQAAYWSKLPRRERPHRLVLLMNAGHMAGAAGCHGFLDRHAAELDRIVLAIHLEHAAREFAERDGELAPTGEPETRWWFTSRHPALEAAVLDALVAEGLDRSLLLPPDLLGPQPTTDGGPFHLRGVPLVNYLTAPFYLFDPMDRLDKIHEPSLAAVTRATIRLVEFTAGFSASALRAEPAS